ncbi:DNA cytosine methyltransferase [Eubacterium sp. am_0171]|uniref:DNA cytosine methyltransferase n=1 Tax=unclassified Eubacterium (in: firmicutes) TaxID=2624479 RepID=UPI00101FC00C|nr:MULTISPECIES: DNA cytosine methyltransferase [unclassified Eubacterium (in: firmicutes)]MSC86289.1 DNA (cytosine-5-)-methyltransferase [Eubacterium sp. BIOML-A1]MSD07250.1 DNA (cytosine-5-)-methyltransferase [Eubacterium sp. BIOML-A2]RYT11779.1 DNA cytosine methyltransferase [Eubacterium sp. am_0171]
MTDYSIDLKEIIAIINSAFIKREKNQKVIHNVTEIFTCDTGEEYLDGRAKYIQSEMKENSDLKDAFSLLASSCKGWSEAGCEECVVRKYCNSYINNKRKIKNTDLSFVDLFCGAGGLSLGFTQLGFYAALANDIEDCCIDTYSHNHPETPRSHIVQGDIKLVIDKLESLLADTSISVVVGGPPCQGFSMANRQRIIDDPRNKLYKYYVEVVRKIQPKFFVMENVKGMLGVSEQVKEDFMRIGYSVECKVFNAKDFGVPQNRERLIFIGNRVGIDNLMIIDEIIDYSKKCPNRVLEDALFGLRTLEASRKRNSTEIDSEESGKRIDRNRSKNSNAYIDEINCGKTNAIVFNHKARYNNDRDIEIFGRLNQGDKSDDPKIADIMPYARRNGIFKDKYFKLENKKICKTITAHMKFDCNMYIHPTQARGLTPREAARVQSYPDDYYFRGAYTKTYMQIGNSVPPLLGRAIASVLKKYM